MASPQPKYPTRYSPKGFVVASTLLYLLDPVRGRPTAHKLDNHPNDGSARREHSQRNFLESIALICSTSAKGAETASAVCWEPGDASGVVLRLARNHGVPGTLVTMLQQLLHDLVNMLSRKMDTSAIEDEILLRIISLDQDKIHDIVDRLQRNSVQNDILKLCQSGETEEKSFPSSRQQIPKAWTAKLRELLNITSTTPPPTLALHIKWASEARWSYSAELEHFLSSKLGRTPPWINNLYKLGRYYAAARAIIKMVFKEPETFRTIRVLPLDATRKQAFRLDKLKDLNKELERITGMKAEQNHQLLSRQLPPETSHPRDPTARFLRPFRHELTVHAEMQLLSFYDRNPELIPRLRFMGTSKKACFLCHEYIKLHPLSMDVSACHQKIYPSWMPPPPPKAEVEERHVRMLRKLQGQLESIVRHDIKHNLDRRPRTMNLDSTAGLPPTNISSVLAWQGG